MWATELDLLAPPDRLVAPLPPGGSEPYSAAYLLLRVGSEPLMMAPVELEDGELDVEATIRPLLADQRPRLAELETRALGEAEPGFDTPPISVVIATRDRPEKVAACVDGVLKQGYPAPVEVIVVDNNSTDDATERIMTERFDSDQRVRYRRVDQKGLSRARNAGLAEANHPITAFLSDDIQVGGNWLLALARGFARSEDVRCVLGYCPQLHLDTELQQTFEHMMKWGSTNGFEPFLAGEAGRTDPLHPYRIALANGSNMAFDTEYFRSAGGFDLALGPGTAARGGEDLDAPVRVLLAGFDIAYEPAAIGWHDDDQTDRRFMAKMYTYGLGMTAFLTSHLVDPRTRWRLLGRVPHGVRYLLPVGGRAHHPAPPFRGARVRRRYWVANLAGRALGPVALARAELTARRAGEARSAGRPIPGPGSGDGREHEPEAPAGPAS